MKKTMIIAALAALVSLASCQKEGITDNGTDQKASPVFTASIAGPTKTTIDLSDGKVAWEETDEITVTDASKAFAIYKIESIDVTTGKATFVIEPSETPLGAGPYSATYGTEPAIGQNYSETPGKLYMTAPETSGNSFTFTVQCGLMKLNLTSSDENVRNIAVTGTPTDGSETTYTLTCDGVNISDGKDFFIALPAGTYTEIAITNGDEKTCTLKGSVDIAANHIKPVTLGEGKVKFEKDKPDGKLPGKFTINEYGAQVYFSQGNLYYDGADFRFEEHQYDSTPDSDDDWNETHISHFFWSAYSYVATAEEYDDSSASEDDIFFTNEEETTADSGFTVYVGEDEQTGVWRTLSADEWLYLFDNREVNGGTEDGYSYSLNITYGGKMGVVLYPDDYEGPVLSTSTNYSDQNFPKGCVFLPVAGWRYNTSVNEFGTYSYYWSSFTNNGNCAISVQIHSDSVTSYGTESRYNGFSVRLVTDVPAK